MTVTSIKKERCIRLFEEERNQIVGMLVGNGKEEGKCPVIINPFFTSKTPLSFSKPPPPSPLHYVEVLGISTTTTLQ